MLKMNKTLLFIPMYNCEKQIVRVLDQLTPEICNYISEVIIVNNRSTDHGEDAVIQYLSEKRIQTKVKLLRNNENYGLGGSHKVAFNYAIDNGFDYVIVLHGDDQGNIQDLVPYLKNREAYRYDSFLGSRFEKRSKLVNYSAFRIFGNHVFNLLMSIVLRKRITDLGSGLNMYRVDYLRSKFYLRFINSLTFNVYMLMYGVYAKSNFKFFALEWREEDQIRNAKFIKQSKEILKLANAYCIHAKNLFSAEKNEYSRMRYEYSLICDNTQVGNEVL